MKSIQNLLMSLCQALNGIDEDITFYHYEKAEDFNGGKYGVWSEEGEADSDHEDNKKTNQVISGSVDYFTTEEFDVIVDKVQETLNDLEGCSWRLDAVQYEDETSLIHYTWSWELV